MAYEQKDRTLDKFKMKIKKELNNFNRPWSLLSQIQFFCK